MIFKRKCLDCGDEFQTAYYQTVRCAHCQEIYRKMVKADYYRVDRHQDPIYQRQEFNSAINNRRYLVLYDPVPVESGGFIPGAKIERDALIPMIEFGALLPGSKILDVKTKKTYLINKDLRRKEIKCPE